ncbi:MAG: FAD-binding oxidoreductase, partial [Verrucomicrobia bacterium]|nr:FAD-binding oxidoreductase [Verrucomicrobiota bacterium]
MTKTHTLIVGQGLAGTLLAWQLIRLGQTVMIVDREDAVTSSKVAGGIVTPITGMRMVKTWRLDEFYPVALEFYRWIEKQSDRSLYFEKPIQRLFKNIDEQNLFDQRMKEPGFADYVLEAGVPNNKGLLSNNGGFVMQGGYLDVALFLTVSREYFTEQQCYQIGEIKPKSLDVHPSSVRWGGTDFSRVVFCEGWTGRDNSFFDWVPFKPAKGEVLEISCEGLGNE